MLGAIGRPRHRLWDQLRVYDDFGGSFFGGPVIRSRTPSLFGRVMVPDRQRIEDRDSYGTLMSNAGRDRHRANRRLAIIVGCSIRD